MNLPQTIMACGIVLTTTALAVLYPTASLLVGVVLIVVVLMLRVWAAW